MRCNLQKLVKVRHGSCQLFCEESSSSSRLTVAFLVSVIKACGILNELQIGKLAQFTAIQSGLAPDIFVANSLITMYSKCQILPKARKVFERMPLHSVVSWNSMISGYSESQEKALALELFFQMLQQARCEPDPRTFVAAAGACSGSAGKQDSDGELLNGGSLELAMAIHSEALKHGCCENIFVANALVDMFGKCGSAIEARRVFEGISNRDVISWTSMMLALVDNGESELALELFSRMKAGECAPNSRTFVAALKACASSASRGGSKARLLEIGREIHSLASESGFELDLYVGSSLLDMYGKCGSLREARLVFQRMPRRDVVAWNSFLLACVENGEGELALEMFKLMRERGDCSPDSLTFTAALMACSSSAVKGGKPTHWLETGMELHSQLVNSGFGDELGAGNTLVDMYSKCGDACRAWGVFHSLPQRSLVSWNALIQCFVDAGECERALELFWRMDCPPSPRTLVTVLMACGKLSTALETGRGIHSQVCARGLESDEFVVNSLVDFYSRSGSLLNAQRVFDSAPGRSLVLWSSLVAGYGYHGDARSVLEVFEMIVGDGFRPDGVVFSSVLAACSHAGLVSEGRRLFWRMVSEFGVKPEIDHYHCLIDLLGRGNRLQEALELARGMPFRASRVTWNTLLAASQKWNDVELEKIAVEALEQLI